MHKSWYKLFKQSWLRLWLQEPRQSAAVLCIVFSRHPGAFKKPGAGSESGLAGCVTGSAVAQGGLDIQRLKNPIADHEDVLVWPIFISWLLYKKIGIRSGLQ